MNSSCRNRFIETMSRDCAAGGIPADVSWLMFLGLTPARLRWCDRIEEPIVDALGWRPSKDMALEYLGDPHVPIGATEGGGPFSGAVFRAPLGREVIERFDGLISLHWHHLITDTRSRMARTLPRVAIADHLPEAHCNKPLRPAIDADPSL